MNRMAMAATATALLAAAVMMGAQGQSQERLRSRPEAARPLDIYWIDVEGGASTLIVTPKGQSVLMDAGWGGFDSAESSAAGSSGTR